MRKRTLVAIGGGGLDVEFPPMEKYLRSLTGKSRPKVCFIPTASADSDALIIRFMASFGALGARPAFLKLFSRTVEDIRSFLLDRDMIYVGGGNTGNMLAIWKSQGVGDVLREAWERGIVVCGGSAGSLCWYECGITDVCRNVLMLVRDCLGFLKGSHCPHYHHKTWRKDYLRFVRKGLLPAGIAADDHVAVRYEGTELIEVVAARPKSYAWLVERSGRKVREKRLKPRMI
jgi:dipeptidase E